MLVLDRLTDAGRHELAAVLQQGAFHLAVPLPRHPARQVGTMTELINAAVFWPTLLMALVIFGAAPNFVLRLLLLAYLKDHSGGDRYWYGEAVLMLGGLDPDLPCYAVAHGIVCDVVWR